MAGVPENVTNTVSNEPTEVRISCGQCPSKFRRPSDLHVHIRDVHLGIRKFPCGICGKHFARSFVRTRHIYSVCDPTLTKEKKKQMQKQNSTPRVQVKQKCKICDKVLSSNSSLLRHMRTVHGAKNPRARADKVTMHPVSSPSLRVILSPVDKPVPIAGNGGEDLKSGALHAVNAILVMRDSKESLAGPSD